MIISADTLMRLTDKDPPPPKIEIDSVPIKRHRIQFAFSVFYSSGNNRYNNIAFLCIQLSFQRNPFRYM